MGGTSLVEGLTVTKALRSASTRRRRKKSDEMKSGGGIALFLRARQYRSRRRHAHVPPGAHC